MSEDLLYNENKSESKESQNSKKIGKNQNWFCEHGFRLISIISDHLSTHAIEATRNEHFVECTIVATLTIQIVKRDESAMVKQ